MKKKLVIYRFVVLTFSMALIGGFVNFYARPSVQMAAAPLEVKADHIEINPRIRAMQEHGEEMPQVEQELNTIQKEIDQRELELEEFRKHDNMIGERMPPPVFRVEQRKADLRRVLVELRTRQLNIIRENYPPAAGEDDMGMTASGDMSVAGDGGEGTKEAPAVAEPYTEEYPPAAAAAPGFFEGLTAVYFLDKMFNGFWLIGQIVVSAWAARKWSQAKKEEAHGT